MLGRAALCARGRRPAREPSTPRASLGASARSPARPRHRPRAPQPGPVGQVAWLAETPIAFARWYLCGIETAIAFADAKSVFLAQFLGAVVLVVSMSPRYRALCAKKFALHAQNTPKSAFLRLLGELFRGRAAGGGALGEFFADQQSWDLTGRVLIQRGPGRWAPLAVLTLQCAATPTW